MKKNLGVIVGGTTFALFMVEAIMHYNMGKKYTKDNDGKETKVLEIPEKNELIKLALIVGTFSILNGMIINYVKKSI